MSFSTLNCSTNNNCHNYLMSPPNFQVAYKGLFLKTVGGHSFSKFRNMIQISTVSVNSHSQCNKKYAKIQKEVVKQLLFIASKLKNINYKLNLFTNTVRTIIEASPHWFSFGKSKAKQLQICIPALVFLIQICQSFAYDPTGHHKASHLALLSHPTYIQSFPCHSPTMNMIGNKMCVMYYNHEIGSN